MSGSAGRAPGEPLAVSAPAAAAPARPAAPPARTVQAGAGDEPPAGGAAAQGLPAEQRVLRFQQHLAVPVRSGRDERAERAGHGVRGGGHEGRQGPGAGGHGQHGGVPAATFPAGARPARHRAAGPSGGDVTRRRAGVTQARSRVP